MIPPVENLKKGKIPSTVAFFDGPDQEIEPFRFSFKHYNEKECQLENLDKNGAKKVLKVIKKIGKLADIKEFSQNGIDIKPVYYGGDYISLFKGLSPDTEMKEHIIQSTERFFYFILDRTIFIVCITHKHYETDKTRRR